MKARLVSIAPSTLCRPAEVAALLNAQGLRCTRVLGRTAKNERLLVLKAAWPDGGRQRGAGGTAALPKADAAGGSSDGGPGS